MMKPMMPMQALTSHTVSTGAALRRCNTFNTQDPSFHYAGQAKSSDRNCQSCFFSAIIRGKWNTALLYGQLQPRKIHLLFQYVAEIMIYLFHFRST